MLLNLYDSNAARAEKIEVVDKRSIFYPFTLRIFGADDSVHYCRHTDNKEIYKLAIDDSLRKIEIHFSKAKPQEHARSYWSYHFRDLLLAHH